MDDDVFLVVDDGLIDWVVFDLLIHQGNSGRRMVLIRLIKIVLLFKLWHCDIHNRAIKYIIRHRDKGKKQDLLKAIHFIEMIIERDYKWNVFIVTQK